MVAGDAHPFLGRQSRTIGNFWQVPQAEVGAHSAAPRRKPFEAAMTNYFDLNTTNDM